MLKYKHVLLLIIPMAVLIDLGIFLSKSQCSSQSTLVYPPQIIMCRPCDHGVFSKCKHFKQKLQTTASKFFHIKKWHM